MRCTQCNRPTKGHKKPTGKHWSLLPIVSDVAEESHKWTNTNGISPDMKRREQHRKQYKINKANIVHLMRRREQKRKQYNINKANIVHVMRRREQKRKQYKINKEKMVRKEVSPEQVMKRREQWRNYYKMRKTQIKKVEAKNAYVAWNNTSQTMDSPTVDVFTIPRMSKKCCKCGALMFPFEKHVGNLGSKYDIDDTGQASFSLCCSYGRLVVLIFMH